MHLLKTILLLAVAAYAAPVPEAAPGSAILEKHEPEVQARNCYNWIKRGEEATEGNSC